MITEELIEQMLEALLHARSHDDPDYTAHAAITAAKEYLAALEQEPVNQMLLAEEVIGCFRAAEIEGLQEALAETTDERLKDLVERRLMHALYAAEQAAQKGKA